MNEDGQHLISEVFAEAGMSSALASRFEVALDIAVERIAQERLADHWLRLIHRLRPTLFGTCLHRVLVRDDEPVKEAARRLRVSPKAVRKCEARIRELLRGGPPA